MKIFQAMLFVVPLSSCGKQARYEPVSALPLTKEVRAADLAKGRNAAKLHPGFVSAFYRDNQCIEKVFREFETSDVKIRVRMNGEMKAESKDVFGRVRRKASNRLSKLCEAIEGWECGLSVAILFEKGVWTDRELGDLIDDFEQNLFARGFERILFLGASGGGIRVYKDARSSRS